MQRSSKVVARIVRRVTNGDLAPERAAELLGVSPRTIYNYVKKYVSQGPEGLLDRRQGHFLKIGPDEEMRIVACKLDNPSRSARWIRDRLKLAVSVETVRLVLLKHSLNRLRLQLPGRSSTSTYRWDPF